jgi:hypothetical protein
MFQDSSIALGELTVDDIQTQLTVIGKTDIVPYRIEPQLLFTLIAPQPFNLQAQGDGHPVKQPNHGLLGA